MTIMGFIFIIALVAAGFFIGRLSCRDNYIQGYQLGRKVATWRVQNGAWQMSRRAYQARD
jgi:hypothetical protein